MMCREICRSDVSIQPSATATHLQPARAKLIHDTKIMAALGSLMGAKNKTTVNDVFNNAFRHRSDLTLAPIDAMASELGLKSSEVLPVLEAAREVIRKSLYKASGEVDYNAIVNNCDPTLDDRLKKLIAKVVGTLSCPRVPRVLFSP